MLDALPPPPYRIGLVAPYGNLTQVFARAATGLPCTLSIRKGMALEEAVEAARQLIEQEQPEVICSRGGTADYIQANVEIPVVSLSSTAVDLLRLLLPFRSRMRKVAFFNYQESMPEVQRVAQALDMEILEYTFHTREDMTTRMLEAAARGAQLGVGGALVTGMRELCGVDGLLLEVGEDAVRRALGEAFAIARVRRVEQRRQARMLTILNTIAEGIMVTDENNILSLINPAAETLLGIQAEGALGRDSRDVVPNTRTWNVLHSGQPEINELQDINGQTIVTSRVPIHIDGRPIGVVCTFAGAERIRQAEQRLRGSERSRGFTARYRLDDIITRNERMRELKTLAASYAHTDASILIQGESGCGKELFAQGIHLASQRVDAPFVGINCAAIPASLLENELFGHEEGAFTGARRKGKPGYFELAHKGTIFLDEISELPGDLQSRLLRVLQEREVMRVGGERVIPIDVRVICATNKKLQHLVAEGLFRQDLFYRCNVLPLFLPPLRERGNDVLHLATHFLQASVHATPLRALTWKELEVQVGTLLHDYTWPGNVRELYNVMERLALTSVLFPSRSVHSMLEQILGEARVHSAAPPASAASLAASGPPPTGTLKDIVCRAEYEAVVRELAACGGDASRAAARLGISRVSLWRKLRQCPPGSAAAE